MVEVSTYDSDKLSTFRTHHQFAHFAVFETLTAFAELRAWAKERGLPVFILGNGSNTLFTRKRINTLVLQNKLPAGIKMTGDDTFVVEAATQVIKVLKACEKEGRSSFYFLASVPAMVGGALAMNAGEGMGATIFDFVEDLTYFDGEKEVTVPRAEIDLAHRRTMFTGVQDKLIVRATFVFPKVDNVANEVRKRAHWARDNQDLASPNVGSIFRSYHRPILRMMRRMPPGGISYPLFRTQFSRRVNNWIITRSKSSRPIVFMIRLVQVVHRLFGKRAETEVIEVR